VKINICLYILFLSFISLKARAYPDFISYGYKTCVTCHYTGSGGGALNDYGRAVFASELTATTFTNKTPDQLADSSGFLGSTELPYWIRPGFKYRGLWYKQNVGNKQSVERWIQMQADAYLAIPLDKKQKYLLAANYGYIPTPDSSRYSKDDKPSNWISKEHYFRWQFNKGQFLYFGLMDKTYGIRHPDHTAYNRSILGLGQSDQSHGVTYQLSRESYEFFAQAFIGNLNQSVDIRQKGIALSGEKFIGHGLSVGASTILSESDYKKESRFAVLSRVGFAKGKSILFEAGYLDNKSKTARTERDAYGIYSFMQGLIGLDQGYNFLTSYQFLKENLRDPAGTEQNKLSLGLMAFLFPRTEMRLEIVNLRTTATQNTRPDQWNLLGQVHVSW